ncbi:MAG: hypothetical protein AAF317_08045 [Pseudomonadota bacterium]
MNWIRSLFAFVSLFAAASPAATKAVDEHEQRPAIERLDEIRGALLEQHGATEEDEDVKTAQWFNWPNWNNWYNWPNWGNYWTNF